MSVPFLGGVAAFSSALPSVGGENFFTASAILVELCVCVRVFVCVCVCVYVHCVCVRACVVCVRVVCERKRDESVHYTVQPFASQFLVPIAHCTLQSIT